MINSRCIQCYNTIIRLLIISLRIIVENYLDFTYFEHKEIFNELENHNIVSICRLCF